MKLILVAGPPACGKSTLCRELVSSSQPKNTVLHLEADTIIRPCDHSTVVYKEERVRLFEAVSGIIQSKCHDIVLLDDCFHLRGMRKPYMRLCARLGIGFGIIWLHSHVDDSLQRNMERPHPVDAQSISRIYSSMEPPSNDDNVLMLQSFSDSLIIDTFDFIVQCDRILTPVTATVEHGTQTEPESFKHALNNALNRTIGEMIRDGQISWTPDVQIQKQLFMDDYGDCRSLDLSMLQIHFKHRLSLG